MHGRPFQFEVPAADRAGALFHGLWLQPACQQAGNLVR